MAKYTDAKCRLCRREGVKLYLKGARCFSPKCPIDKKGAQVPGQHGKKRSRSRVTGYGLQLREKQKTKRTYGVLEKQFHNYYESAIKSKGNTGELMMQLLESRLDNMVYRLGITASRSQARQLVSHGHIIVNDIKTDIPSFQTKPGMTIKVDDKGAQFNFVADGLADPKNKPAAWLSRKGSVGHVDRLPTRDEIGSDIKENLIIEFYSR
jgi:small subunit ribosomal protein S4